MNTQVKDIISLTVHLVNVFLIVCLLKNSCLCMHGLLIYY
jgi:hypothetical protein